MDIDRVEDWLCHPVTIELRKEIDAAIDGLKDEPRIIHGDMDQTALKNATVYGGIEALEGVKDTINEMRGK